MKKLLTVLLAALMVFSCVPALAETLTEAGGELKTFPLTVYNDLDVQLPLHNALKNETGELEFYYKVVYDGYYDISMTTAAGNSGSAFDIDDWDLRCYIPENSHYSQSTVFLMVPSATDPYQFMVDSGWKDVADANSITMYLLMPDRIKDENGVATAWGAWADKSVDEVMNYIACAVNVAGQRPGIQTVSYCFYGIGYEDAATLMTQYIMGHPTAMAGAFAVGDLGDLSAFMAEMKAKASAEPGVTVAQIANPFGVVALADDAEAAAVVEYYQAANKTVKEAAQKGIFTYYAPDAAAAVRTPDSEPVAAVFTLDAEPAACMNAEFAQAVYDELYVVRRYPGHPNTELRAYTDVYKDSHYEYYTTLTALGRYTYGGDIAAEGDGEYYNREWWVYVPDTAKARMDNGEKVEAVFAFMGSNGYGDEIAQRGGWDQLAEDNGFIVVCPSGHIRHQGNFGNADRHGVNVYQYCTNWNWTSKNATPIVPDDLLMIDDIYEWLFTVSAYKDSVDASKVYATGQSAGGGFTHYVGKQRPQYFAAVMPSSWIGSADEADTSSDVAFVVMMGQKDTTVAGAFSSSARMSPNGEAMFAEYIGRYELADNQGRSSWSDFTFLEDDAVCTVKEGSFNQYIFTTKKGVPMFVGVEITDMTHAMMPSEITYAWNIMQHFSKDPETHVLYYDGEVVDTPSNLALAGM
jgi:poly(3-hydroxybutyrate) depolymerase